MIYICKLHERTYTDGLSPTKFHQQTLNTDSINMNASPPTTARKMRTTNAIIQYNLPSISSENTTPTAPQPLSPPCGLFALPPELRNMIYNFTFTPAILATKSPEESPINLISDRAPSSSPLLTNHQFHNEAHGIYKQAYRDYWKTSDFIIHDSLAASGHISHLSHLSPLDVEDIQHLKIVLWGPTTTHGCAWNGPQVEYKQPRKIWTLCGGGGGAKGRYWKVETIKDVLDFEKPFTSYEDVDLAEIPLEKCERTQWTNFVGTRTVAMVDDENEAVREGEERISLREQILRIMEGWKEGEGWRQVRFYSVAGGWRMAWRWRG